MKLKLSLAAIFFILSGHILSAQSPTITSFSPASGPVGTLVTISGTNLGSPTAFSIGGVSAIAVSNTGTQLVGMVMPGAVTGTASVTSAWGAATSTTNFTITATQFPSMQQGDKLVGTGNIGNAYQGTSVAISADGKTAVVGAPGDNTGVGALWVFVRVGSTWTQQAKLIGTGISSPNSIYQGVAVAINADGNTIVAGASGDGAAYVFVRTEGVWNQQGSKLVEIGAFQLGTSTQEGNSVAISADGNTIIIGGSQDNYSEGAAWVFTRNNAAWTQQGDKLVGTGTVGGYPDGDIQQGFAVAISADGNTAIVGGFTDNYGVGAAWVYVRNSNVWTQQGNKLVGTDGVGAEPYQGFSVALSADGNTAAIGGPADEISGYDEGAVWIFTRNGINWLQQGEKLVGTGGNNGVNNSSSILQGSSVSLSADGNTLVEGGDYDNNGGGATWVFTRNLTTWTQQGNKLVGIGNIGLAGQGQSVSVSADGNTAIIGGISDNNGIGAAWVFTAPSLNISLIDPFPNMIDNSGNLLTDVTKIDMTNTVKGAATDGVSKILLVANWNSPVTFTLNSSSDGSLMRLDGTASTGLSLTVQPVAGIVAAVYTSPDGYGSSNPVGGRNINIQAADANDNTTVATIKLVTPPVVLVHGMWSGPSAWTTPIPPFTGGFQSAISSFLQQKVYLVDYHETSSQTFDPGEPFESNPAKFAIMEQRANAYDDMKAQGIIALQVDMVAHSLGGLHARNYSQDPNFLQALNYKKGFIHKLITIGTPHLGSELGPVIYYANSLPVNIDSKPSRLSNIAGIISNYPVGTAQRDFNPAFKHTGKGLDNLIAETLFKVHAIVGRWDSPGVDQTSVWSDGWQKLILMYAGAPSSESSINTQFGALLADVVNDLVVPSYSQLGGLTDGKTYDIFNNTTHSDPPHIPTGYPETTNLQIIYTVNGLLSSNDPTLFAKGFPAPNTVPTPFDQANTQSLKKTQTVKTKNSKMTLTANLNTDSLYSAQHNFLKITSPVITSVFTNNGKDTLTLALTFSDTSKLANAVFFVQNVGVVGLPNQSPYSTKIALPNSVTAGTLTIAALANDIYGNLFADTVSVTIQGTDTLKAITTSPDSLVLDSLNRTASISVTGLYVNGADTVYRNITAAGAGTTYALVSKNAIISISSAGLVNGLKAGADTVLVANQGFTAKITITVSQNLINAPKFADTISFSVSSQTYGNSPFVLNGSNLSGNPISYAVLSGPINIANGVATITGVGQAKIIASSAGNAYYNMAANDTVTFSIKKGVQTISFNSLPATALGTADFSPGATTNSGLQISYTSSNTAVATIVNNKIHLIAVGSTAITASQVGNANYTAASSVAQTLMVNPSNNAGLSNLKLSSETLSPTFASGTTSYTGSVANGVNAVTVTPTTSNANATVTVNGTAVISGSTSQSLPLVVGANTIAVVVTAQDGVTKNTYTLVVTEAPSSNANLTGINPTGGPLTPAFSSTTTGYTLSVSNAITAVTIKPVTGGANATIKVNGIATSSGTVFGPIALAEGANTIVSIVVTAQDGVTAKTYTLTVTRAPSSNAGLSNITLSKGSLTPAFATATSSYTDMVANSNPSVTLTPTAADPTATITVNGTAVASGKASAAIPLVVGSNTITTVVTAQDGVTVKTYKVTVIRPSNNAKLSGIKLSTGTLAPIFVSTTNSYTASVAYTVSSITATPTISVAGATVTIDGTAVASGKASGSIPLIIGANTITIVVTAQDGVTTNTYTVTVTRSAPSSNANLSNIVLSKGTLTPAFASGTTSYTAMAANTTSSVTLKPTASNATATITVNGAAVASGKASAAIPLTIGNNTVTTVVTAQDGITTQTYTVTVIRPSNNDKLSSLKLSTGTLSPIFASTTTSYTASVANTVSSVTVTPTVSVSTSTVTVDGTAVASGNASQSIALAVGANTITTIVTAQDGVTTETYTVTVTRASGGADSYIPIAIGTGISVIQPTETPGLADDGILVHQAVSPNGDGINDFLQIDNISQYPDNKLSIMNRNGQLIYEVQSYDNSSKVFDGHSNKNGQMQLPGTYFYQLDYTANGITKHKTGFFVLRY